MRLAVDTWAFVESILDGPRRPEVERALVHAESTWTTREIVAETCNFIVGRTGRTAPANHWLATLRASRTRIVEPPMEKIEGLMRAIGDNGSMSYADASLAVLAIEQGIEYVATQDGAFREARLVPLFAKPELRSQAQQERRRRFENKTDLGPERCDDRRRTGR